MTNTTMRAWSGPAFLSYGFRPFFLLAAIQAIVSIGIWVPWFLGMAAPRLGLPPAAWHAHSLLFAYVWAVIAGFLLTAVPSWTGRRPIVGWPLAVLVALFLGGRFATTGILRLPAAPQALIDLAFPVALIALVAREILAARNWRNAKVVVALIALALSQALFHYEVERFGVGEISERMATATVITLITLIAGRIIPAFTGNWLKQRSPAGRLPAPFASIDVMAQSLGALALAAWVLAPRFSLPDGALGAALVVAGMLHLVRQVRWMPERTLREPLVAILHAGYLFIGLGFLLTGASALTAGHVSESAGLHAWTGGAIATMTLAVMTRASLGHTGRALTAGVITTFVYLAIVVAAFLRIAAALAPGQTLLLVPLAGLAWLAAFGGFLVGYTKLLLQPRREV